MNKKIVIDAFHKHEVLDRLHVQMETISANIIDHSYFYINHKAKKKVEKAICFLMEAYHLVGSDDMFEGDE